MFMLFSVHIGALVLVSWWLVVASLTTMLVY